MSATNGKPHLPLANGHPAAGSTNARTPSDDPRSEYRNLKAENRLRAERIRAHRLATAETREARRRNLAESLSLDWVTPYAELLNLSARTGDPVLAGPTSYWQRRQGSNWPIYQTEAELNLLRAPSRLLLATNGYAQGLVEGLTSYVIGSGCTYRVGKASDSDDLPAEVIDAAQRVVDDILRQAQWFGGEQPGIEEELFGRSIEDGEWILAHYPQEDGTCEFRIQEPEQLTIPPGEDFATYGFGVLTPRNDAAKVLRYYLQYGDSPGQGEEHEPDEVTHFRRNVRRNMKRGVPDFCFDTYDRLHLAGRLCTNLGDTAAQQASIVAVRQWETGSEDELQSFNDDDADLTQSDPLTGTQERIKVRRRGSWEDIPKGMAYVPGPIASATPIHIQVLDACLRSAGQKWQAPPWLMSGDLNAMNYATSLTAESPFVKTIQRRQRGYTEAFRRPVWFALAHRIRVRGLRDRTGRVWSWEEIGSRLELTVTAPDPQTRNKLEDAQRASVEIPLGVQSRQAYMQEQGRDPDQIEADNQEYADSLGPPGNPLPTDLPPGTDGGGTDVRTSGLPESLLESADLAESLTGDEYLNLLESGRVLLEWRDGLTAKTIPVTRGGRTFQTTVYVRTDTAQGAERRARTEGPEAAIDRAFREPRSMTPEDVKALKDHIRRMPKERLRQLALAARHRIGPTKKAIAERLLTHVRSSRAGSGSGSGRPSGGSSGSSSGSSPPASPPPPPSTAAPGGGRSPIAPAAARATLPRATITGSVEARRVVNALFGRGDIISGVETTPPELLAAAVTAVDGTHPISGAVDEDPHHPFVYFETDFNGQNGYTVMREFSRDLHGDVFVDNHYFRIFKEPNPNYNPATDPPRKKFRNKDRNLNGTEMLVNQVRALRELGVKYMKTHAARLDHRDPNRAMNGYATWPKLGYDDSIPTYTYSSLPPDLKTLVDSNPTGSTRPRSILNLMTTEAGQKWWEEHGTSLPTCRFDLSDGSLSMRTLEAYINQINAGKSA